MRKLYILIVTLCCLFTYSRLSAQCSVTISTNPATTQLTCTNKTITLTANVTGTAPITYLWSTGDTTRSIIVSKAGTDTVKITANAVCSTTTFITITKDTIAPVVSIAAFPESICAGGSATLVGLGAATYSWLPGPLTGPIVTVSPTSTTTYILTGRAFNGCTHDSSFRLIVNPLPTATIKGSTAVCENAEAPLITFNGFNGIKPYTFTYRINGGPNQTITTTGTNDSVAVSAQTGTIGLVNYDLISVTDSAGCTQSQTGTAAINVLNGALLTSAKTASICNNAPFSYNATSSAANTSFTWERQIAIGISNSAGTGSSAIINESLTNTTDQPLDVKYIFKLSTGTGCITTDSLKLTVNPTPVINTITNKTYCNGESVTGGIPFSSSSPGTIFSWLNSDTSIGLATSGTGNIYPFVARNTTGNPVTANITVFVKASSDSCAGASTTFTITVLPAPILTSAKTASICDNAPFSYQAASSAANTAFSWTRALVTGLSNSSSSGATATVSETLDNTTTDLKIATYIFKLTTINGCITTDSLKLTINPTPIINKINDTTYCNGKFVEGGIPFTSSSLGVGFRWVNSDTTIGLPAMGTGNIPPFIPKNNTGDSIKASITVFVFLKTSTDSCVGASTTFTITVRPAPVLISTKDTSICNNAAFSYQAISSAANTSFSWSRALVTGITNAVSSGTTATISETLTNTTDKPVVVTYLFTLSTGTGCITTDSLKLTVNPTPVTDPITNKIYCNGKFVEGGIPFSSSSPGAGFRWVNSNTAIGLAATGTGNIPPFIPRNTTSDSIKATITVFIKASTDSCAGASTTFTITVLPAPVLTSTRDTSICNNTVFSYQATSSAANTSFSWSRAVVTGITNAVSSGTTATISETLANTTDLPVVVTYLFTLFTGTGCIITDSLKLTVNPTPKTNPITNKTYCNGKFVEGGIPFSSSSPGAGFRWVNSNNTIGLAAMGTGNIPPFIPRNTTGDSITATITVFVFLKTSADSCAGVVTTFTITVLPAPVLTSTSDTSICDNNLFTYTATSSDTVTIFRWQREAVPGISLPAHTDTLAKFINETLHNTTDTPIVVKYLFTLSTGGGCDTSETLNVTVNPTPKINSIRDTTYCNGSLAQPIFFTSPSPNAVISWTSDKQIGFGTNGSSSIPAFIVRNPDSISVVATVTVQIKASKDSCQGRDTTLRITVLPTPFLISAKSVSICNANPFVYHARSFAEKTDFTWTRNSIAGISNTAVLLPVNDSTINETLINITDTPIVVTYHYRLSTGTGNGCNTMDSIKVTVNPTPKIKTETIKPYKYCNLEMVNGIKFSSPSPNASFKWTTDKSIGFGLSGKDSIPVFTASNPGTTQVTATVTVYITASSDSCRGRDTSFTITVNPSAPKPNFTSLSRYADTDTLKLCSGSNNINFNINTPVNSIAYKWTSPTIDGTILTIRDTNDANTVVSFIKPGDFIIKAIATNIANGGCTDTVSQAVKINAINGIDERKIFEKKPGNLLVYPDNSLDILTGYQWGYDSLITVSPNVSFGRPISIQGQVYQFFIPENRLLENNTLDTVRRSYWVLLRLGDCTSKVYYNGPYAGRAAQIIATDNEVRVQVFPNPNRGSFEIALKGNIYGSINAKIYNSIGQVVWRKNFIKLMPEIIENFTTTNLPVGLYFIELNSSNLKKIVTRFLIQQ